MGSTNFLQWNPTEANQETDAQYLADAMRVAGAVNPSIVPSVMLNKVFYQLTTFVAAFAQALATKGLTVSDSSLTALAGVLANIITSTDLASALSLYAPKASPVFTGTPTAPTPGAGDNSAKLATTAWVDAAFATTAWVLAQNYSPESWVSANFALQSWIVAQGYAPESWVTTNFAPDSAFQNSLALDGYQKLPGGLIAQWGFLSISGSGQVATFPISFPTNCWLVIGSDSGASCNSVGCLVLNNSQVSLYAKDHTGAFATTGVAWFAIGN